MSGTAKEVDFLHMFNEQAPPPKEKVGSRLNKFWLRETELKDQLRLWRKDVTKENPDNKDLLTYLKSSKQEKIDLIKKDIAKFGAMKVTFGTLVNFKRERNGEIQTKRQWFHEKEPHLFTRANEHEIGEKYDKYIEDIMGQVKAWNSKT